MAGNTLFQAEIDVALAERTRKARSRFRLTNAEMLRAALEDLCAKLESMPSPFPEKPDAS